MKSVARVSAWMVLAAVLSCAPCAFGQGTTSKGTQKAGVSLSNHAIASFWALSIAPAVVYGHRSNNGNNGNNGNGGNGCSNQGGPRGWESSGWNGGGGGCATSVPEGGSAWMYLLMGGFCCAGGLFMRSQAQNRPASAN
jgi:hypothetical protein